MKRFFSWVLALLGPLLLLSLLFAIHVVGTCLHSAKLSSQAAAMLNSEPLSPKILEKLGVLFEAEQTTPEWTKAERLLEVGELAETKQFEVLNEKLSSPKAPNQLKMSPEEIAQLKSLLNPEAPKQEAPEDDLDQEASETTEEELEKQVEESDQEPPTPAVEPDIKRIRNFLIERLKPLLTPKVTAAEYDTYNLIRDSLAPFGVELQAISATSVQEQ